MLSGVPPQVTLKPRLAKITAQLHLKAFAKFAPGLARPSSEGGNWLSVNY
jgi:hypothetical protein